VRWGRVACTGRKQGARGAAVMGGALYNGAAEGDFGGPGGVGAATRWGRTRGSSPDQRVAPRPL
jgi:hypothetical protein